MWTKKLLAQACAIALAAPFAVSAEETCVGRFYSQGQEAEGIPLPEVHIVTNALPSVSAGETLSFDLNYTIAPGGTPNAFWCTEDGELSAATADALNATFTAPAEIAETKVIRLGVQLADGHGYVTGDSLYLQLLGDNATTDFSGTVTDGDGVPLEGITLTIGDQTVTTNAEGKFTVSGLEPGTYAISLDNFASLDVSLPLETSTCMQAEGSEAGNDDAGDNGAASQNGKKMTICHKGKTISISKNAWPAHRDNHGDTEGACASDDDSSSTTISLCLQPGITPPPPPPPPPEDEGLQPGEEVTGLFTGVPDQPGDGFNSDFDVPDLEAEDIIAGGDPVAEDIEDLINDDDIIDSDETYTVTQDDDSGNLEVVIAGSGMQIIVMPVQVFIPYLYDQPGMTLTDSGGVQIVTANGAKVVVHPAVQAPQALVAALQNADVFQIGMESGTAAFLEDLGVHADIVEMDIDGTLTVYPGLYEMTGMKYSAKPGLVSVLAPEGAEADTLAAADSALLPAGNGKLFKLHFNDKNGKLKMQTLYPAAANVGALLEIDSVTIDAAGPGTMSFKAHGKIHTVLFDYAVAKGEAPDYGLEFHPIDDANDDGVDDYQVVYANGDTQKAFVIDSE